MRALHAWTRTTQPDAGSGASQPTILARQRRLLELSADEPTFSYHRDDFQPGFISTSSAEDFTKFLSKRLQLSVAKETRIMVGLKFCLYDIDQHEPLDIIDIEVAYKAIDMLLADKGYPPAVAQLKRLPSLFQCPMADQEELVSDLYRPT